jgi:hypothetical protein
MFGKKKKNQTYANFFLLKKIHTIYNALSLDILYSTINSPNHYRVLKLYNKVNTSANFSLE